MIFNKRSLVVLGSLALMSAITSCNSGSSVASTRPSQLDQNNSTQLTQLNGFSANSPITDIENVNDRLFAISSGNAISQIQDIETGATQTIQTLLIGYLNNNDPVYIVPNNSTSQFILASSNVPVNQYSFSNALQGNSFTINNNSGQGQFGGASPFQGPFSKDDNGNYVSISRNMIQNPTLGVAGYANGASFNFKTTDNNLHAINYKSASMIYDSTGVGSVCCWHGDLNLQVVYTGYDNNLSKDVLGWNVGTQKPTDLPQLPEYGNNVIYAAPFGKTLPAVKLVNGMGQNGTGVYPIAVFAEYDSSSNTTNIKSIELSHVYRKVYGKTNVQIIPHDFFTIQGKVSKIDSEGIYGENAAVLYVMTNDRIYIVKAKAKMYNQNNDDWYFSHSDPNIAEIYSTPNKITAFKLIKNQALRGGVGNFLVGTDKGFVYGNFRSLPQTVDPNNIPPITPQVGCSYVISPLGYPSLICQYYQAGNYLGLNAPNYKYVSVFGYGAGGGGGVSCTDHDGSKGGSGRKHYSLYIPNAFTNYYNIYVASGGEGNQHEYYGGGGGGGGSSAVETSNTTLGLGGVLHIGGGGGGGGSDCFHSAPKDGGADGGDAGANGNGYGGGAGYNGKSGFGGNAGMYDLNQGYPGGSGVDGGGGSGGGSGGGGGNPTTASGGIGYSNGGVGISNMPAVAIASGGGGGAGYGGGGGGNGIGTIYSNYASGGGGGGGNYSFQSIITVPYSGRANNGGASTGYDEAGGNGGNGYELLIFTNVSTGAFTNENDLPSGPWIGSCTPVSYNGVTLVASCQTGHDSSITNTVTVDPDGNCNNVNGNLECKVD